MSSEAVPADQWACTAAVLEETPAAAVVANLGTAAYILAGVDDRPRNFYCWGSMGVTTPIGLGVAMGTDDPVTVLDGDGSTLMSLGALATVAEYGPDNLVVVIFDNAAYATTGGQPTRGEATDFAAVAADLGLRSFDVDTDADFATAYADAVAHDGPAVVACSVEAIDPDARPPLDFAHVKRRFHEAVAGD